MGEPRADTWMPFYVADYLKDTTHLSTIEHGAYFLLLMHAWTHDGLLPSDERRLARIAGMTSREWRKSATVLLEYFTRENDGFRHGRVDRELARAGEKIEQRRAAGRASAEARALQRDGQRNGNGRSTEGATGALRNSRPSPSTEEEKVPLDKESNGATPDSDKAFWDNAKAYLRDEAKDPGALIGKWVRDHGKRSTADALTRAQLDRPVQKIPFIEGCFRRKAETYDPDRITV